MKTRTTSPVRPAPGSDDATLTPVPLDTWYAIQNWLIEECRALDEHRYDDWLSMLTQDIVYQVPVRVTREKGPGSEFSDDLHHLDETFETLSLRVRRLATDFAWAEDPPSRTRHFVSNVQGFFRDGNAGSVLVRSSLLVYRNRGSAPSHDLLSGERVDLLQAADGQWRLQRRTVLLDQATLGTKNLAIFL